MKISQKIIEIAILIGSIPILCWAIINFQYRDPGIFIFGSLSLMTIPFQYPLGLLFMGLPLLMSVSILHGVSACVLATIPYALIGVALLRDSSLYRKFFIFAFLICNAFLYSIAFHLVVPSRLRATSDVILGTVVMTAVAFAFSFIARQRGRRKENVSLAAAFVMAGIFAALAGILKNYFAFAPFLLLPLVGISSIFYQLMQERQHLRKLLEEYELPKPPAPQL